MVCAQLVSLPAGPQMGMSDPTASPSHLHRTLPGKPGPSGGPYLLASAHLTRMVSTTGRRSLCSLILSARLWQGVYTSMARRVF